MMGPRDFGLCTVQTAYRCVNVCGWNTDPPSSLQIILTMLLIVGAVLARDGGHAYSGSNFVLYLSTRSCANQVQCSYTSKHLWDAAVSFLRSVREATGGYHGTYLSKAAFVKYGILSSMEQNKAGNLRH